MKPVWMLSMLPMLLAIPAYAGKVDLETGEGCFGVECFDGEFEIPAVTRPPNDDDVEVDTAKLCETISTRVYELCLKSPNADAAACVTEREESLDRCENPVDHVDADQPAGPSLGPTSMDKPLLVVSGDFDGDNLTDTVQGFPEASDGAGRVDVFWGAAGFKVAWPTVLSAIKNPKTRLLSGRLGESLAVGDFNGDGLDDLAIGAPHANFTDPVARTHSGSVVVIYGCGAPACQSVQSSGAGSLAVGATRSSLDPRITAGALRIAPLTEVDFGRFGKSLASGDFEDDGYDDLAIGAPGDKVGAAGGAGSVTVIRGGPGGLDLGTRRLLHQDLLPAGASPAEAEDHFGSALGAARLDLDDDDDLVVGVPDEDYGSEVNAGEVNVFWGGTAGLRGPNYVSFRHSIAMAGADKSGDRLGYDLRAFNRTVGLAGKQIPGRLHLGLVEAGECAGRSGNLSVPDIKAAVPVANLECEVDIRSAASTIGDGALPEIPVNFIVIANPATVGGGASNLNKLPDADWGGFDPITRGAISGAAYFGAQIDLLNQQVRADDGNPVCKGNDCLRFAYRRHTYYRPSMFQEGNRHACPKLHAISNPSGNLISESPLEITEEGNPSGPVAGRYASLSDLAEAAVDECALLMDDDALNVIIYDVCSRVGPDGDENTADDILDCAIAYNGRGRTNGTRPYMFVDYARALLPRNPSETFPRAAEEHEAGHAFGLNHACEPKDPADPAVSANWTRPNGTHAMQGGDCVGPIPRNLGFATRIRMDDQKHWVVEVDTMIQTARELAKAWRSPAAPTLKPPIEPKLTEAVPHSTR